MNRVLIIRIDFFSSPQSQNIPSQTLFQLLAITVMVFSLLMLSEVRVFIPTLEVRAYPIIIFAYVRHTSSECRYWM